MATTIFRRVARGARCDDRLRRAARMLMRSANGAITAMRNSRQQIGPPQQIQQRRSAACAPLSTCSNLNLSDHAIAGRQTN